AVSLPGEHDGNLLGAGAGQRIPGRPADLELDGRRVGGLAHVQNSHPWAGWLPGGLDLLAKVPLGGNRSGWLTRCRLVDIRRYEGPSLTSIAGLDRPDVAGDHAEWRRRIDGRRTGGGEEGRADPGNRQYAHADERQPGGAIDA